MRRSKLDQLIAAGESETVEFKLSLERLPPIARAVAAFANGRRGGIILVGLTDAGQIVGVERRVRQRGSARRLCAEVRRQLRTEVQPAPRLRVRSVDLDGVPLLLIEARSGWGGGPHRAGRVYVRRGTQTVAATPDEVAVLEKQRHRRRWINRLRRGLAYGAVLAALLLVVLGACTALVIADVQRGMRLWADTPAGFYVYRPVFAPDGKTVVVHGYDKVAGHWNLYAITRGDGHPRQLTDVREPQSNDEWGNEFLGSFSPDGKWIAYTCAASDPEICLYDWQTGETRQITHLAGWIERPTFSPDGQWVLCDAALEGQPYGRDLYLMRPDGSQGHWLTQTPALHEWEPAFSPDGRWIVFVGQSDAGGVDLYRWRWGEAEPQRITFDPQVRESRPSFSPDGEWIVFASNRNALKPPTDSNGEIAVIRPDGSDRRVVSGMIDMDPVFSPDGREILFVSALHIPLSRLHSVRFAGRDLAQRPSYRLFCFIVGRALALLSP